MMQAVKQRVSGELLLQGKKNGLILQQLKPPAEAENLVYLRYALVTRGPADHIFPALVLDDWGRERATLGLYEWIDENGDRFPRAEIFGFERDGREAQAFLRAMELRARYPCYAYTAPDQPLKEGHLLFAIFVRDDSADAPERIKRPAELKLPLRAARVTWWRIPPGSEEIDLDRLGAEPDPGY